MRLRKRTEKRRAELSAALATRPLEIRSRSGVRPLNPVEPVEEAAERPSRRVALPIPFRRRWQALSPDQQIRVAKGFGAFIVGLVLGWLLLGPLGMPWPFDQPEPSPPPPPVITFADLSPADQQTLITAASHLYAYKDDSQIAAALLHKYSALALACQMVAAEQDAAQKMRLMKVVGKLNSPHGCPAP